MSLFTETHRDGSGIPNANVNGNGFYVRNGANESSPTEAAALTKGDFSAATPTMYAEYAGAVQRTLNRMPWDQVHAVVEALVRTWQNGGQVFLMGNGGSASTASHLACDLSKNTVQAGLPRMRAIALNDNMALMSAYANDVGYDAVFAEQLRALAQPGDLVLAISTSGNSPNVISAIEMARKMHLSTVGLCGYTGGKLATMVDIAVVAPNHCVEQIEDIHMMLAHLVTVGLRSAMNAALVRGDEFLNGVMVQNHAPIGQPAVHASSNGHVANGHVANGHVANGHVANGYARSGSVSNPVSNGSNGNGHVTGGDAHGKRDNGNHSAGYGQPAVASGYWQNSSAPLSGHD